MVRARISIQNTSPGLWIRSSTGNLQLCDIEKFIRSHRGASPMSVKLTTRHRGGVAIVETSGKVTLGEGTSTLRRNIRELVDADTLQIILNMAEVTYMDSSGVGELLASHTTV